MKKIFAVLLSITAFVFVFSACGKNEQDLNFVITVDEVASNGYSWFVDIEKKGVVNLVEQTALTIQNQTVFTFEAVGEGETQVMLSFSNSAETDTIRIVKYTLTSDKDFKITGQLISDETPTETQKSEPLSSEEAENLVKNKYSSDEYYVNVADTLKKDGKTVYLVKVSEIVKNENGQTILKFHEMYYVDENGNLTKAETSEFDEKLTQDEEIFLK